MKHLQYIPKISSIVSLIILCILLLQGCVKNEVSIEFSLPAKVNDAYKMTYYASDKAKGWYVETVAAVQQGKAKITLATRNPSLVFIMGNDPVPRAVFYIERGNKIKISGDGNNPVSWMIKGNELSEEWSRWRISSRTALSSANGSKINTAVAYYVKKNPEKPLSTLLLLTYYDRRLNPSGFNSLWKLLKGKALEPKWIQLVGRSDMLPEAPLLPENPNLLILRSLGNGVDTLKLDSIPAILYFWRNADSERDNGINILRNLSKDYPDSASRIIADISFDSDSLSWSSRAKRDSLSKVLRAWEIHAEADTTLMRMGIERTPWFIVLDSKGKQKYAGENPEMADSIFRKSFPTKKP